MRIGLLGGTFDPPHSGHLIIAEHVRVTLALDQVRFISAWVPPHKKTVPISDGKHRLAMLRLAIELNPHFVANDRELVRQGVSYTVGTLREMRKEGGSKELVLLIGADNLAIFGERLEPDEIARLATVVVMRRPLNGFQFSASQRCRRFM